MMYLIVRRLKKWKVRTLMKLYKWEKQQLARIEETRFDK